MSHPLQSVSQRYQKPGGARGFGPQPVVDVLTPQIPPTYPPAPKPSPLSPDAMEKATVYKRFSQYLGSNYGMQTPQAKSAFTVERFTDKYHSLLAVNPDIVPRLGADRLPEELLTLPKQFKRTRKPKLAKAKGTIDDLHEEEEQKEDKDAEPVAKKSRDRAHANPADDNLEEEDAEDADEELDAGTDYAHTYFDNGEDFLDSDHEGGDDDGPVY